MKWIAKYSDMKFQLDKEPERPRFIEIIKDLAFLIGFVLVIILQWAWVAF